MFVSVGGSISLRDRGAAALANIPLGAALKLMGKWEGVLVLNYHRIGDSEGQPWDRVMWSVTAEELDNHLQALARDAEVIAPEDICAAIRAGRGRRVLITFDDGYRDNYEFAFPLLRKHGLTATFFLATGFLDDPHVAWWDEIAWMVRGAARTQSATWTRDDWAQDLGTRPASTPDGESLVPVGVLLAGDDEDATIVELIERYRMLPDGEGERFLEQLARALGVGRCETSDARDLWMTWDMAREMLAAGMGIGGHTVSHPLLARLSVERQREEIATCARRLREEMGTAMRWFAYPVGLRDAFTLQTQEVVRDCGAELAFSYYGGFVRSAHWNPMDVPRLHVDEKLTSRLLVTALGLSRAFSG